MSQQQEIDRQVLVNKPSLVTEARNGDKVRIISEENEKYLDESYDKILTHLRENHDQNASSDEKDKMYGDAIAMWNEVSSKSRGKLNDISFDLVLHRKECQYLGDLLHNKLEYNVDTVFYAIELKNLVDELLRTKFDSDEQAVGVTMTLVDVQYLYHIISAMTVKGLGKSTFMYATIITRIGDSSRVFNYYKTRFDALHAAISYWGASLDKGVALDMNDPSYEFIWGGSDNKPVFATPKAEEVTEGTALQPQPQPETQL